MASRRTALAGLLATPLFGGGLPAGLLPWPVRLVRAGRAQIGVTTGYDGAYRRLAYPGGDVPVRTGVCTDVVIRAYRAAFGFDFQSGVHEDMRAAFSAYPDRWGLSAPDPNTDHRRVPNLETFLARQGAERPPEGWQAGDLFTGRLTGTGLPHIAIVSSRVSPASGRALMIHNIGRGTEEGDAWPLFEGARRFRFAPPARPPA